MGATHHRRFRHLMVSHQSTFNLCGAQAVAGHVDHIVDPAGNPVIAILIAAGTIPGAILAGEGGEIGLHKAFMIPPQGTHLARPTVGNHQIAFGGPGQHMAFVIHQLRANSVERLGGSARLMHRAAGQGGNHHPPGFRLPPGVNHLRLSGSDHVVIPLPRCRINGFAGGGHNAQATSAGMGKGRLPFCHEGTNGRWRRV
tara:strand:- start:109651 stop:110247 length:597 start_codon:yes stop_codon:yes gene_type:complete